jgi:hypothetical protein
MEETRNMLRIFVEKQFRRPRRRQENNIKMNLRETVKDVNWFEMA